MHGDSEAARRSFRLRPNRVSKNENVGQQTENIFKPGSADVMRWITVDWEKGQESEQMRVDGG